MTLAEQAELGLRLVREHPLIAYDTETTGLNWKIHQPVGYVITADVQNNVYVPVRHGGGGNLFDPNVAPMSAPDAPTVQHAFERELAKAFKERQSKPGFVTVGHNIKFDMHLSANQGIVLGRNVEDTGINEPLIDEHQFTYGLDACAKRHGVTAKLGESMYEHISRVLGIPLPNKASSVMEHFWRLPGNDKMVRDYSTGDGITTLELRIAQLRLLDDVDDVGSSRRFIHGVESKLIYTLFRMERRGIKIDVDYVRDLRASVEAELIASRNSLPPGFNERSPLDTRKVMEDAGITDWPLTAKGAPSPLKIPLSS